jgi:hypothetical protein
VRDFQPQLTRFTPEYADLHGLVVHASDLDRRLLPPLDRAAWEETVADVRRRLTDEVLGRAVGRLPAEHRALHGDLLRDALRARRDALPEAAASYYALLATDVDLHATDADEHAAIDRHPDGSVEVRVTAAGAATPHLHRRFDPAETREVRVHLHGGDDRAVVRGAAPRSILVRVIGGGGDDTLVDASRVAEGRRTVLHDHRGDNRFEPGTGARVDTRAWEEPERESLFGNPPSPRDWGSTASPLGPGVGWRSRIGPLVSVGPVWTRYGFRRRPYAERTALRLAWAPYRGGFELAAGHDRVRTGTDAGTLLRARASSMDFMRFHGYGNDTPGSAERRYEVELRRVGASARWYRGRGTRLRFEAGPEVRWTDPGPVEALHDPTVELRGERSYAQAGLEGGLTWDGRDDAQQPRRGGWLRAGGRGYASDFGPFGGVDAEARGYLSAGSAGPTLALRAGGIAALGAFPLQDAAFVGGLGSLRGHPDGRFAGDRAAYAGAALRQRLAPVDLRVIRGRLGVMAMADAGRVSLDGRSPGGWHTGAGAGLWLESVGRVATAALVRGDAWRLYLTLGPQF